MMTSFMFTEAQLDSCLRGFSIALTMLSTIQIFANDLNLPRHALKYYPTAHDQSTTFELFANGDRSILSELADFGAAIFAIGLTKWFATGWSRLIEETDF